MTPFTSPDSTQIQQWASRQLADYDARMPGTLFAENLSLSLSDAYELQAAVSQLRCARGEKVIGHKVGCTSPAIRRQLGIDHSISGRLYDSEEHSTGTTHTISEFAELAIEGELAVELSREPTETDFESATIPACVSRVFPVIELHNLVMRGNNPTAGELIANNAIHAGFVAGFGASLDDFDADPKLDAAQLSIFVDNKLIDRCNGSNLIETINSSLQWLSKLARERNDPLQAGQTVLTGSIPGLIPIRENCRVRIEAPPFGNVDARFVT